MSYCLGERGVTRAFADDTATVLDEFFINFPKIASIFDTYGEISGLYLNYSKTIIVPLWLERELSYEKIKDALVELGAAGARCAFTIRPSTWASM